jgi:hypothetical protein
VALFPIIHLWASSFLSASDVKTLSSSDCVLPQYSAATKKLSVLARQRVLTCLAQQNRITDLVMCATDCESLTNLPKDIQTPVAELFGFASV